MIVRHLHTLGDEARLHTDAGTHHGLVLDHDRLGFALYDARFLAGSRTVVEHGGQGEAVYCLEGTGAIEDLRTGGRHEVTPGTVYTLEPGDRHALVAHTRLRVLWVARRAPDEAHPSPSADSLAATARP